MTDIAQLIKDLGAAPEGSRELSDRVLLVLVYTDYTFYNPLIGRHDVKPNRPDPTCSVDDVLGLYPVGKQVNVSRYSDGTGCVEYLGWKTREKANTPALALCVALLKAKEKAPPE